MRIHNLQTTIIRDEKIVSGSLDDFVLWYRLPLEYGNTDRADPFLAAALMIAMSTGEDIHIDEQWPVSFKLLQGLNELQDIFGVWFEGLSSISVHATTTKASSSQNGYATFFSGGVDSLFTFYKRLPVLSHAIFLGGIDMQLDNTELYQEVLLRNQEFCDNHGVTLIPVTTNLRELCHPAGLGWGSKFSGAGLASVALLLGFPFTLVPASQTYNSMYREGTSPCTDHLFSNEATTIYYDGGFSRAEKLCYLSQFPDAMSLLRVCWQDQGYNCGKCEKCLRTRLILKIIGVDCPTLPRLENLSELKDWRIESDAQKAIFKNMLAAVDRKTHPEIYRFLKRIQYREKLKRWLVKTDLKVFNGKLKAGFEKLFQFILKGA